MKLGNKVIRILAVDLDTFTVRLRFQDGISGVVSLRSVFSRPKGLAAEILRGGMFQNCFVEAGALAWPNGYELCPDVLRHWLHTRPVVRLHRGSSIARASSQRTRLTARKRPHRAAARQASR